MKRVRVLIFLMISIFSLTGCWDYRELNDLAFALAMGVDKIPDTGEYRFSFQLVNAQEIAGEAGKKAPVVVYSGKGDTLFEAVRETSEKSPRRINFEHVRDYIIGEELAKEGIEEVFELIERDAEPRMTTRVFIARGIDAETMLKTRTSVEMIPTNSILGKLKISSHVLGEAYEVQIDDVIRGLLVKGGGPVISGIDHLGDPKTGQKRTNVDNSDPPAQMHVSGMALFKDAKLVGWVNNEEAKGLSWINHEMQSTIINLDCGKKKNAIAIELLRTRTKKEGEIRNGQPVVKVTIEQIGIVGEAMCPIDLSKSEEIRKLERQLEEETTNHVKVMVDKAKELETDVLGFGEAILRADPKAWQEMEKEWDKIFPTIQVEVNVESTIRRTGQVSKPYLLEME